MVGQANRLVLGHIGYKAGYQVCYPTFNWEGCGRRVGAGGNGKQAVEIRPGQNSRDGSHQHMSRLAEGGLFGSGRREIIEIPFGMSGG